MSDYIYTDSGRINSDEKDQKLAKYCLDVMATWIKEGRKAGGFDSRDVRELVKKWFQAAQYLRDPQYPRMHYPFYIRDAPPPPTGRKSSEMLLNAVERLSRFMLPNENAHHTIPYFVTAEAAMLTFVNEFRKGLKASNPEALKTFIGEVAAMGRQGKV